MDIRYIIINKSDEDEYNIVKTIRDLGEYITEMYLINKSHMYYHRKLKRMSRIKMGEIIIIKIIL